jgi:DNA replication protein DnaC
MAQQAPFADVVARMRIVDPADLEADAKLQRATEARAVRDQLPVYVRTAPHDALARRITGAGLLEAARTWRPEAGNLVFLGPTEAGKSSAAAYAFRRLLSLGVNHGGAVWERAKGMAWFGGDDLANERKAWRLGAGDAPDFTRACRATVLFLDDLSWDRDPQVASEVLAARYELGAPTLVTSGKTTDELDAQYGTAVTRRITQAGGKKARIVRCFK